MAILSEEEYLLLKEKVYSLHGDFQIFDSYLIQDKNTIRKMHILRKEITRLCKDLEIYERDHDVS